MFAPSTIVTVTVEANADGDEIHFYAGGQGFWIARLLGRLGVPTTLCTVFGGETGQVARVLVESEPISVRAVDSEHSNHAWVHDRRSGDRRSVAETPGHSLGRHCVDELVGATVTAGLEAGICVLAGPHHPNLIAAEHYERLAADLRSNGATVIADLLRKRVGGCSGRRRRPVQDERRGPGPQRRLRRAR